MTQFDLQFTLNLVVGTAVLNPASAFFIGGMDAFFFNGQFVDYGSPASVFISPATSFSGRFKINPSLNRFEHQVGFGSQINYGLQPGSVVTQLPEPSTLLLLGSGLAGAFFSRRRKAS